MLGYVGDARMTLYFTNLSIYVFSEEHIGYVSGRNCGRYKRIVPQGELTFKGHHFGTSQSAMET